MAFYTLNTSPNGHEYVVFTGSAASAFLLPKASTIPGLSFVFKNQGTGTATISAMTGDTVDGAATLVLSTQYSNIILFSDGNSWNVATAASSGGGGEASVFTGSAAPNNADGRPDGTVYIQTA